MGKVALVAESAVCGDCGDGNLGGPEQLAGAVNAGFAHEFGERPTGALMKKLGKVGSRDPGLPGHFIAGQRRAGFPADDFQRPCDNRGKLIVLAALDGFKNPDKRFPEPCGQVLVVFDCREFGEVSEPHAQNFGLGGAGLHRRP